MIDHHVHEQLAKETRIEFEIRPGKNVWAVVARANWIGVKAESFTVLHVENDWGAPTQEQFKEAKERAKHGCLVKLTVKMREIAAWLNQHFYRDNPKKKGGEEQADAG